jgi:hypothetical protein
MGTVSWWALINLKKEEPSRRMGEILEALSMAKNVIKIFFLSLPLSLLKS